MPEVSERNSSAWRKCECACLSLGYSGPPGLCERKSNRQRQNKTWPPAIWSRGQAIWLLPARWCLSGKTMGARAERVYMWGGKRPPKEREVQEVAEMVQGSIHPLGPGDDFRALNGRTVLHHWSPWHVLLILPLTRRILPRGFVHTQRAKVHVFNTCVSLCVQRHTRKVLRHCRAEDKNCVKRPCRS